MISASISVILCEIVTWQDITSSLTAQGGLGIPEGPQDIFQGPQGQNSFHDNTKVCFLLSFSFSHEYRWNFLEAT